MRERLQHRAEFVLAGVLILAACGSGDSRDYREICGRDGVCWRAQNYAAPPSESACVSGRVHPCDDGSCPAHRYVSEREGECRPFGETDRTFCTSGLEVWLVPLHGRTRWSRKEQLDSTDLCVEETTRREYRSCLVHLDAYRWRSCSRDGRSGVALDWRIDRKEVPNDRDFRIVVRAMIE